MMNDIEIVWQTGKMIIHLDGLFPCSQEQFKKLLKIVKLDWEHENEILNTLKVYFQNQLKEIEALHKDISKEYYGCINLLHYAEERTKTHKHPNGVYLSDNDVVYYKKEVKKLKKDKEKCMKTAKICKRNTKKFQKYLEMMQSG